MTLRCPACREDNPATNKFCGSCGTRLPLVWRACDHPNPPGRRFCGECGAALTPEAQPAAATVPEPEEVAGLAVSPAEAMPSSAFRDAAPAAYTPKHLAEKILGSRSAVEGERKLVTVMFTDVSGFTAMSERLDPEEVHAIMDRAFQVIIDAVHRYEGTINQFLGDGVMALFGAPIAHEDHPHRALRAALAIQDGLSPLKKEIRGTHGMKFRVRMGINTGLVFVGAIGRDLRMDYTAVGDTTNLAARLLSLAGPGQIFVSAPTKRLTEGFFNFEDAGEFAVKGKAERVRVFEAKSEIRGRTRLEVSRDRGLTPLVGREAELERLAECYRRAAEGRGGVVLVTGDPGIGKSRLLYEFLRSLEGTGVLELEATCLSHGGSIPYHPIVELLRRYLGLPEGTPGEVIRQRVADALRSLGVESEEPLLLVAHFLGVSAPEQFLTRLAGAELKQRTFAALRALLLGAAAARPAVFVVENLHWLDASSGEFLQYLVEGLPGHRVFLVLSSRPGFEAPWLTPPLAETMAVEGLDAVGVRRMIRTLLGVEEVAEPLLKVLLDRGEGNPLYVEEILRQLQETGGILVEAGEARLGGADVRVPATIHDIIAARIDRLPEPVKQTLQVAAVVGRQFALPLLARVLKTDGGLATHVSDLQAGDFLFLTASEPEALYTFKHALTQEVAYASLLERRRRVYHAEVGTGLEEFYAGRTDEVVELLAHHFGRSRQDEKAVDYAILAAEKAQGRWANIEALAYFEAARKRLEPMPDTDPNRLRRIDAVVKQAEIKFALGRHAEHVQALEAIRELVEAVADPGRRAAWYYWTGFLHNLTGARPEVPIRYCRQAVEIAEAAGLEEIRAFAECCLAHVYQVVGDFRRSIAAGERALAVFEARGNIWWACRTLWGLIFVANAMGEWARALEYCRRARDHGQAANDLRLKVVGWWRTGAVHVARGDVDAGLRCYEEALALSPIPFDAAMIRAGQGHAMIKAGQVAAGLAQLEEAIAWFERANLPYTRLSWLWPLAEGYLKQADRSRARAIAEEVLATSRGLGYRHFEALAERVLGESLAVEDPPAAASHLDMATRIFEDLGASNHVAKALVVRAELCRAAGDRMGAQALLERALAIFESLGTLDEPPRVRATLVALRAADLGQGWFIVSRDRPDLYQHLVQEFAGNENVKVLLDRRQGERRQSGDANLPDRRRVDRRSRPDVEVEIRSIGYAIVAEDLGG